MRFLILLLVIAAFVGISVYSTRTDVMKLPIDRAWAQAEVEKLPLSNDHKKPYIAEIQTATTAKEAQGVVWKARWEGDPTYRAEKTHEMNADKAELERTEPIRRWALWIGAPLFFAFAFFTVRQQMVH